MSVAARYFDGLTARAYPVELTIDGARATLRGEGIERTLPLAQLKIGEALGRAPRRIEFADGAFCEVADHAGLAAMLAASGIRTGTVERIQTSWHWAIAAIVLSVATLGAVWKWGVPWVAIVVAERIPASAVEKMSEEALASMDAKLFKPSQTPAARQEAIRALFASWQPPHADRVAYRIEFRDTRIGANALALPSGLIVVTDDLVKLTDDDRLIAAVLAHELGHVKERHGLRQVVSASIVGLAVAWWFSDVSSVFTILPTVILQMHYSRELETAADDYAARMLKANGHPPALLADMLEKLEASHTKGPKQGDDGKSILDYVSSHPATAARLARLRAL